MNKQKTKTQYPITKKNPQIVKLVGSWGDGCLVVTFGSLWRIFH